jgi:hypothetical protein
MFAPGTVADKNNKALPSPPSSIHERRWRRGHAGASAAVLGREAASRCARWSSTVVTGEAALAHEPESPRAAEAEMEHDEVRDGPGGGQGERST